MFRFSKVFLFLIFGSLAGCAEKNQPSADKIARLQGGTTKVVVYGFCVPMDRLIKTTITRQSLTYKVNGKPVGTMNTCSYATFKVPSGYWESVFVGSGFSFFASYVPGMIFHPGKTQYLYMRPAGNGTYEGSWVSKAEADKGIAEIKSINQMF